MKIVVLAESPADRVAIETLALAIVEVDVEYELYVPPAGGIDAVLTAIRPALLSFHYMRKAEGLIVVVDSNGSQIEQEHVEGRVHLIQNEVDQIQSQLKPLPNYKPIKTAVGVAAPSIESWLLFGIDNQCTEAAWIIRHKEGNSSVADIQRLKKQMFGTDRPDIHTETKIMKQHATRLVEESRIEALEQSFPYGFGQLAKDLRAW